MAWCIVCSNIVLSIKSMKRWLWSIDPRDGSNICLGNFYVDICSVCNERQEKRQREEDRKK